MNNTCGNCLNCYKVAEGTKNEFWACEVYGLHNGYPCPADVSPPYDTACKDWSSVKGE